MMSNITGTADATDIAQMPYSAFFASLVRNIVDFEYILNLQRKEWTPMEVQIGW